MNATSAPLPRGQNEFDHAGLTMAACRLVAAPRIRESPAALECKVVEVVAIRDRVGRAGAAMSSFLGEVVGFHIDERLHPRRPLRRHASQAARPLGYQDYAVVEAVFALARTT